jgi:hypothetical protein
MKFISIILISIGLAACGSDDNNKETFLEGSWLSPCEDYSEGGTRYGQSTFTFNNSNLVVVNRTYDSTSCDGDTFATIATSSGNISIEEDATLASGQVVTRFKMNITNMTLVFNQQDEVNNQNSNAYCGHTDWEVGVSKNVLVCRLGSDTTILDIGLIDGNNLFLGEGVESGYPTELEGQAHIRL